MPPRSTSTARSNIHGAKVMLCIWWDRLGVVYYELLKPSETNTGDWYLTQLMGLSRALKKKRPQYQERYDKVILQYDNARPYVARLVNTYLETLKWEMRSYPIRHTLQMLLLPTTICFDRWHTAWLISISALIKKSKNGSIRGSHQKTHRFFEMVSENCLKDGKK